MFEQASPVIKRVKESKIKPILDQYSECLVARHYSLGTIRHYRHILEHFLNWLKSKRISCRTPINNSTVILFIYEHIPSCQCPKPAPKRERDLRAALHVFLKIQREKFGYVASSIPVSRTDKLLNEFDDYLANMIGLVEKTRSYHLKNTKMFLSKIFRLDSIRFSRLTPQNVREFLYNNPKTCSRKTFKLFVYSIRTFFKFLKFKGMIHQSLIDALPTITVWKSAALPDALDKNDINKLMKAIDRKADVGKRDYAIITCLLETGMRLHEVANLKLDDIDWHAQTITLSSAKTRRKDVLPISEKVVGALINYLKHGRPRTDSRQVFVNHYVKKGSAIIPHAVSGVIQRTFLKAGLTSFTIGSNVLRRTFATNLLKKGATIKEISDLLRHRSINTTAIYTKVDFKRLARVALPWPQEQFL